MQRLSRLIRSISRDLMGKRGSFFVTAEECVGSEQCGGLLQPRIHVEPRTFGGEEGVMARQKATPAALAEGLLTDLC